MSPFNKEAFQRLLELNETCKLTQERLIRLRSEAERSTALLDGLPKDSLMRSKIEETVVKMHSAIAELESLLPEHWALKEELKEETKSLPRKEGFVLRLRYIDQLSYRRIADALNCSISHVFRLHRRALKKILSQDTKGDKRI